VKRRLVAPDPPLSDGVVALRPPNQEDRATIVAACQDPEVLRWTLIPEPYTDDDAGAFLALADAGWSIGIAAFFAMTSAGQPDHLIGSISLDFPREGPGDVGYWVAAEARGRGVATRALRLVSHWAFETHGVEAILLRTLDGNTGSERVAAKAGYVVIGESTCIQRGRERPNQVWRLEPSAPTLNRR
jgi:RimJ/RimL family protein N-acetyltransferase